jgi:hypothetical protein
MNLPAIVKKQKSKHFASLFFIFEIRAARSGEPIHFGRRIAAN